MRSWPPRRGARVVLLALVCACDTPTAPPGSRVDEAREAPAREPNGDDDRDGIVNAADACPELAEDLDRFEDEDGCPDRDNDGDGVLDAAAYVDGEWINCDGGRTYYRLAPYYGGHAYGPWRDCRDSPDNSDDNNQRPGDGCPRFFVISCGILTLLRAPLIAREGALRIPPESMAQIEELAAPLVAYPDLQLYVDAHTDAREPKQRAIRETKAIAEELIDELVTRHPDIERAQLIPRGFGGEQPIADNKRPEGKLANRRITLVVVNPFEYPNEQTHGVCEFGTPVQRRACGCETSPERVARAHDGARARLR